MKKLPPIIAREINNLLILDFYQKHIGTVFIERNSSSKLMDHGLLGLMTFSSEVGACPLVIDAFCLGGRPDSKSMSQPKRRISFNIGMLLR